MSQSEKPEITLHSKWSTKEKYLRDNDVVYPWFPDQTIKALLERDDALSKLNTQVVCPHCNQSLTLKEVPTHVCEDESKRSLRELLALIEYLNSKDKEDEQRCKE